ncbi:MAG: hypothetical protein ABI416_19630 [Ginsengibacter sp.]
MKIKQLLSIVLIVALGSCSSAFRTGQTPDDVYYSPAPPPPVEYVTTENQQDRDSYAHNNTFNSEDLSIRRGISDPRYRSSIGLDFGYGGYSPYDYFGSSLYSPFSSYYNPYSYSGVTFFPHGYNYNYYGSYSPYNNYYSPFSNYYNSYYPPVYSSVPASNYPSGPRTVNLGAYSNNRTNVNTATIRQQQSATGNTMPVRTISPKPANGSNVGNFIRRVISPSTNNRSYRNENSSNNDNSRSYRNENNSNNNSSSRSFQSSPSGGSSSSSSGSSSAPVRTFK